MWVLWVLAGLLVLAIYFFAVVLISIPLVLPLVLVGGLFGFAVGLVQACGVLLGRSPAEICTPSVFAERRTRLGPLPADDAWPEYFAVQVWWDGRAAIYSSLDWLITAASSARKTLRSRPNLRDAAILAFPISVPIALGALAIAVGVGLGLLLVFAVGAVITGLAWLLGVVVTGILLLRDRLWLAQHRSTAACTRCYHVTPLPAYRCDGEHRPDADGDDGLHFDVRPGRQGVWRRRCGCGRSLPTSVRRARRRLDPHCPLPLCGLPLHPDTGLATDLRIALLGAGSAGKTSILAGIVDDVLSAGAGYRVVPGDTGSDRRVTELRADLAAGRGPMPTDAITAPDALLLHLTKGSQRGLLQLFDASGDHLADPDRASDLAYLDHVRALLFVVDPFGLRPVREQARQLRPDLLERAHAATYPIEQAYQDAAIMLRNADVARGQRIAVLVTKTDLLGELPVGEQLGHTSAEIRDWLTAQQEDNLILAAERDFSGARYFRCAGALTTDHESALAAVRWLLAGEPFRVPAQRRGDRT